MFCLVLFSLLFNNDNDERQVSRNTKLTVYDMHGVDRRQNTFPPRVTSNERASQLILAPPHMLTTFILTSSFLTATVSDSHLSPHPPSHSSLSCSPYLYISPHAFFSSSLSSIHFRGPSLNLADVWLVETM